MKTSHVNPCLGIRNDRWFSRTEKERERERESPARDHNPHVTEMPHEDVAVEDCDEGRV